MSSLQRQKSSNLDKPLSKGKAEVRELILYRQMKCGTSFMSDLKFTFELGCMKKDLQEFFVNVATFALLFSEIVQYCQNRVYTVPELQTKLSDLGQHVGNHLLDILFLRDRGFKREVKLLNMLLFIKGSFWRTLFGKDADKLEQANDDERTYYIIEKEPLVNKFISVPKDKGSLNCAAFTAGIIEAVLNGANFPAKVTVHWHKGTTFMIKFDESVIARDKLVEGK